MGNRAVITASRDALVEESTDLGMYLHWNGGRDSVEAFLKYCELKGFRSVKDGGYGWARLAQVIGNFFGGGLSIGIDQCRNLDCDNWDNGVYIIDGWKIVGRKFHDGPEQQHYKLEDMLEAIDEAQPEKERFGKAFWRAKPTPTSELHVGDKIFVTDHDGKAEIQEVCGIGEPGKIVNGHKVEGVPFCDKYGFDYKNNINNYLFGDEYRVSAVKD